VADEPLLRPGLRPAASLTELDRIRLVQAGVNALGSSRHKGRQQGGLRTLLPEAGIKTDWRYLSSRRLALFIIASVERGTRWVRLEHAGPPLWAQVRAQVTAFFAALERDGAFVGDDAHERYFVICDERLNDRTAVASGQFRLLFGFAAARPRDFQTFLVTHEPDSSAARTVSVNRFALPGQI
jgi:phage tail sheath protein FI